MSDVWVSLMSCVVGLGGLYVLLKPVKAAAVRRPKRAHIGRFAVNKGAPTFETDGNQVKPPAV